MAKHRDLFVLVITSTLGIFLHVLSIHSTTHALNQIQVKGEDIIIASSSVSIPTTFLGVNDKSKGYVSITTDSDKITLSGLRGGSRSALRKIDPVKSQFASIENDNGNGSDKESPPSKAKSTNLIQAMLPKDLQIAQNKPSKSVKTHTIKNVLSVVDVYGSDVAILIYDPAEDTFIAHTPKYHVKGRFITHILPNLTNALRKLFPDRFSGNAEHEVAFAVVSDDYPMVFREDINRCMQHMEGPCGPEDLAPILQFGSVFKSQVIPSMVHMPPPAAYLSGCFYSWVETGEVCKFYQERPPGTHHGFVFGDSLGLEWDDLKPQVMWRGTDMDYLSNFLKTLRKPSFVSDIAPKVKNARIKNVNSTATRALREVYDKLIPRWQGIVLTAEAEREADKKPNSIPWANIKFNRGGGAKKVPASEIPEFIKLETHGIPCIGETIEIEEAAKWKYHIDLGGNGGTTGGGTLEKLSLPGLLFHHETPTYDYIHKWMKPWVHYVPVQSDLSDLKEKFDWAESHQDEAREISGAATLLARRMGTHKGMEALFHEMFEDPLRRVIDAYRPMSQGTWQKAVEGKKMEPTCKRNDHVRCFWNSNTLAKDAAAKCSEEDAKRPSECITL